MARQVLSQQQLEQVIEWRQRGASWLRIQKETNVPRRVAKRAYMEWEQSRSLEDLKAARRNVAAKEFSEHVNSLLKLAESIVTHLHAPHSPNERRKANEVLESLWQHNILEESQKTQAAFTSMGASEIDPIGIEREKRRVIRRNELLFKALQQHTREVRWKCLEEWKYAWNTCITSLLQLHEEARQVIKNIFEQTPGLEEKLRRATQAADVLRPMSEAVVRGVWRGQGFSPFQTAVESQNLFSVTYAEGRELERLRFSERSPAEETARICNWAARNVSEGSRVKQGGDLLHTVEEKLMALEEMLEPLVLRPMIIRSHCSLCPV